MPGPYNKITWTETTPITPGNLDHMEDGIKGAEEYADQRATQEGDSATTRAEEAESAAKAHADTVAAEAETNAKDYAAEDPHGNESHNPVFMKYTPEEDEASDSVQAYDDWRTVKSWSGPYFVVRVQLSASNVDSSSARLRWEAAGFSLVSRSASGTSRNDSVYYIPPGEQLEFQLNEAGFGEGTGDYILIINYLPLD